MPFRYRRFIYAAVLAAPLAMADAEPVVEPDDAEPFPILTATCGDIYELFEDAQPGDGKDQKDVEEAQDDVLYFVTWVHGYLSGRYGIDQEKRPMSEQGIVTTIDDMARVCDPDVDSGGGHRGPGTAAATTADARCPSFLYRRGSGRRQKGPA